MVHELLHLNSFQSVKINKDGEICENRTGFKISSEKIDKMYFEMLDEAIIQELTRRICKNILTADEFSEIQNTYTNAIDYMWAGIRELYQKNQDKFKDEKDVFDIFANVVFTGKIMKAANLIKKTFGEGSFRLAAERTIKK